MVQQSLSKKNTYNCLIADDQLLHRDVLSMHLGKMPEINIAAVCTNGLEAYQALSTMDIDIAFSDINMPELSGLELLKSLKHSPVFIFISDYPEYAAESYSLDVVDYIVKPVTFERLIRAVNKAIEYIELKKIVAEKKATPHAINIEDHFFIRESTDIIKLKFDEVTYIESMGNFSRIHLLSGKHHMALVILKNLESQLPESIFTRVHKQYIINHTHLSSITSSDVIISGQYHIPISQAHRQALLDKVVQHKIVNRNLPE